MVPDHFKSEQFGDLFELWSGFSPQNKHDPAYWGKRFIENRLWGYGSVKIYKF